jgi:hypothetical protein
MFRANRGRLIGITISIFIIYFLFSSSTDSDFRRRTEQGLARKHSVLQGDLSDEVLAQQTNDKLQGILAKQEMNKVVPVGASNAAATEQASKVSEAADDVSVAGRKTMSKPKDNLKPKYPLDSGEDDQKALGGGKSGKIVDVAKDIAREKLQEYLKKPGKFSFYLWLT